MAPKPRSCFNSQPSTTELQHMHTDEEIFDVVDEQDQVIGQGLRGQVHQLGLLHRAVHILVYNSDGELFLQKRSLLKDSSPGLWDSSTAGHLQSGEDYDQAALRELQEELGSIPTQALQRLFKLSPSARNGWEFAWVYRCDMNGPFTLDPLETESGRWLATTELEHWMQQQPEIFTETLLDIWTQLKRLTSIAPKDASQP